MTPQDFLIGIVIAILLLAALLIFGFIRTKKKYEEGQGLLQNQKSAKILKIIFLGMVIAGAIMGLIGFILTR